MEHVQLVLRALAENSLFANIKKFAFGRDKVAYLGHVISSQGVVVDSEN